jgi:hypothetical protein
MEFSDHDDEEDAKKTVKPLKLNYAKTVLIKIYICE